MSYKVIVSPKFLTDDATAILTENGCEMEYKYLEYASDEQVCSIIGGATATIAGGEPYTEKVFQTADSLKIVARVGVGVDTVDLEAATRHGIWVTNTPGATSPAVSEFTIGLILCLLREFPVMFQEMKTGKWNPRCGIELGALTLGIIGAGSIGRQVIEKTHAFGVKALAYDVAPDPSFAAKWNVQYIELDELMSQSDVVSIHCPLNEHTRGLIDARRLNLMKRGSNLINTSRAPVVDKEALIDVLKSGRIAGAATDVHDPAPAAPDDPLTVLDNVIATPWSAYNTTQSIARMCRAAAENIAAVLQGRTPPSAVNTV